MPLAASTATNSHQLVRILQRVCGRMRFEIEIAPRFDGRPAHLTELTANGAVFTANDHRLVLHAVREPDDERLTQVHDHDHDVRATIDLTAGQLRGMVLESAAEGSPREIRPAEIRALMDQTVEFWQSWLTGSIYTGRWREAVGRSAMKLMTYAPTGGLVAAPTTALPEQVGGSATGTTATPGFATPPSRRSRSSSQLLAFILMVT